jgi:hypothetical protein
VLKFAVDDPNLTMLVEAFWRRPLVADQLVGRATLPLRQFFDGEQFGKPARLQLKLHLPEEDPDGGPADGGHGILGAVMKTPTQMGRSIGRKMSKLTSALGGAGLGSPGRRGSGGSGGGGGGSGGGGSGGGGSGGGGGGARDGGRGGINRQQPGPPTATLDLECRWAGSVYEQPWLRVVISEAVDLPVMDRWSRASDPFVKYV